MTQIKDLPVGSAAATALFPADDTDTITRHYTAAQIVAAGGGSAPVSSVAGRTGAITLSRTDISGLGTAAALAAGGPNGLAVLNASGLLPVASITGLSAAATTGIGGANGLFALDASGNASAGLVVAASAYLATATTARSFAARFGDTLNPADFGSPLNGIGTDQAGISAMTAAAPVKGAFYNYPAGSKLNITSVPTYTGFGCHNFNGATSGGSPPVGAGMDLYTNLVNGGILMGRQTTNPSAGAGVLTISGFLTSDIGAAGAYLPLWAPFAINATSSGAVKNNTSLFGMSVVLSANTAGGTQDAVAGSFAATKQSGSHEPVWALLLQCNDRTPGPSSVWGGMTGVELDVNINGLDDAGAAYGYVPAGAGGRAVFDFVLASNTSATPNSVGYMARFGISGRTASGGTTAPGTYNTQVYCERGIAFIGYARTAFVDLTMGLGLPGASGFSGISLPAGMTIGFDGVAMPATTQTAPPHTLVFNSTSGNMEFQHNGIATVGFTDLGGVVAVGNLTSAGHTNSSLYVDTSTQESAPTSGGSVSIPSGCRTYLIAPAAALSSLAITSPPAPTGIAAGASVQVDIVVGGFAVSGVTWAAGSGTSFGGATLPTSIPNGGKVSLLYVQGTGRWYHMTTS